ncbi:MAG: zinc-dependent metalloprotease [Planctomycetota bacterium]
MITFSLSTIVALASFATPIDDSAMNVPPSMPPGMPRGESKSDKEDFPKFEEVVKDMKVREGFFTLYQDEKKDKLFMRVPDEMLEKKFLVATSIAKGPMFAGWMWVDTPAYWERHGKKLVLMQSDARHLPGAGSTIEDVIHRTYTDPILRAVPILTEDAGDVVIDLADLIKSDMAQLGELFKGKVDRGLSRFGNIKNFEKNSEISVALAFMDERRGAMGGQVVEVHFSFSYLPEKDEYEPRVADDRVGYFIVALKDWTVAHDDTTIFKRYINRWRLRKSEPDKDVSDVRPEDQIVFYVEKTVPVKYRQYVREGILEWNKAFEAVGLRNAVVVRQQTDKNEYKDLDPEDVRYNFFRWIVSGIPYAMGPSRANPFTGQILDADIVFDDSMVRYIQQEYDVRGPRAFLGYSDRPLEQFLTQNPSWMPAQERFEPSVHETLQADEALQRWDNSRAWSRQHHDESCEIGEGLRKQLAFAAAAAAESGKRELPEEFIGQAIKETVMHEVGHTLGLRHNFKASSWLKLDDIKARRPEGGQPTTASVMDYNPYTFSATIEGQGSFATPTLGPYDLWAIEYGYKPFKTGDGPKPTPTEETPATQTTAVSTNGQMADKSPKDLKKGSNTEKPTEPATAIAKTRGVDGKDADKPKEPSKGKEKPDGELAMLQAIASRCAEPGLDYATDEDTSMVYPDPYVNRWDNGADPIAFAKDRMTAVEKLWKDGLDWSVKDGESFTHARKALDMLIGEYGWGAVTAARLVGGQHICRDHKGDPNARPPIKVVDPAKQREALKFLAETGLSDTSFQFSPALLNSLAPGRWGHWDTEDFDWDVSYEIHDRILGIQSWMLMQLINPFTLNRVYDSDRLVPVDQDTVTVPEVLRTVTKTVWAELEKASPDKTYTDRQPAISSYRRSLQRYHLQTTINMVLARPGMRLYADVHAVTRLSLKDLGATMDKVLADKRLKLDEFTRSHLMDSSKRIGKALEAEFSANAPSRSESGARITIGKENEGK